MRPDGSLEHRPVCATCGEDWPCREGAAEMNAASVLLSIGSRAGYTFIRDRSGMWVESSIDGARLPLDDERVRVALAADGWRLTDDGMVR